MASSPMKASEFCFRAFGTGLVILAFGSIASCSFNRGQMSSEVAPFLIAIGVLTGLTLAAGIVAAIWEK
jgi:hypothetical protein